MTIKKLSLHLQFSCTFFRQKKTKKLVLYRYDQMIIFLAFHVRIIRKEVDFMQLLNKNQTNNLNR